MQSPIGLFVCYDTNVQHNRIEMFEDSKVLIGLNENGGIEIIENQIKVYIAIIEHKFNTFVLQSLSSYCEYRGQRMKIYEAKILQENDVVRFCYCDQVWEYELMFVHPLVIKNTDSKLVGIQKDNRFLDESLVCGICYQIYQSPVQLQCKHCFCGHCLTNCIKIKLKCPFCSQQITQVNNIMALENLCEYYLRRHPEKAKSTEVCQLYEYENRFKYESKVEYLTKYGTNLNQQQVINAELQVPQCKSCQQQYKDFVCQPQQEHVQCCNKLLPIRQLNVRENAEYKMFCQVCHDYTCKYYYNTTCRSILIVPLYRWGQILKVEHIEFVPQILLDKIQEYLKGLTVDYIISYVMGNFVNKELFQLEGSQKRQIQNGNEQLLNGSPLCYRCMKEVSAQMIIKFFEINFMPQLQGIPNCPNGIHCQLLLQDNKKQHSNTYNHFCRRQV